MTPPCVRLTAITVLDPNAVAYMGHQHYSTTQRYLHHKPRREDAARLHAAFAKSSPSGAKTTPDHAPTR